MHRTHRQATRRPPTRWALLIGAPVLMVATACATAPAPPPAPRPSTAPVTSTPATTAPVTIAAGPGSAPVSSWTMPDLVGANLQDAQDTIKTLTDFGIVLTTSSDASGAKRFQIIYRNWKVCRQSIPPGATITSDSQIDFAAVKLPERCP